MTADWDESRKVRRAVLRCNQAATQPTFICSKLTIETIEKGVKYVQS